MSAHGSAHANAQAHASTPHAQPLRISATLVTPIASSPSGPPHIDALLAWVVAQRRLAEGPCDTATLRALPLPIVRDEDTGCAQASMLVFAPAETAWTQGTVRRTDVDVLLADAARGVTTIGEKGVLNLASGKLRNYVVHVPRQWITQVEGWAIGDPTAIAALLADVRHVGPKGRIDAGRVSAEGWRVEPDARAATRWRWRHLPVGATLPPDPEGVTRVTMEGACQAPYWDRTTFELCTRPVFPAITTITNVDHEAAAHTAEG
jgi:CRISPR type IV-associated protein Csf3